MVQRTMHDRLQDVLGLEWVRAGIEGLGGLSLVFSSYASVAFHIYLGTMSAIGATCGAILGLHAVCRLIIPICRHMRPTPKIHETGETEDV